MRSILVIFVTIFSTAWSQSDHVTCYNCYQLSGHCNGTHCYAKTSCVETCIVKGSCMLIRELNTYTDEVLISSSCFPQVVDFNDLSTGENQISKDSCQQKQDENIYEEDMNIIANNISSVNCLCLGDLCNDVLISPKTLANDSEELADSSVLLTVIGGTAGLCLVGIILLVWRCLLVRQRTLDDDKKALNDAFNRTPNRLSSDGSSLLEGTWDESGRNSCSTYKYSTSLSSGYSRDSKANAFNQNNQHLPIKLLEVIGRGQFAEVWKAQLEQDGDKSQILSVKVFRLHNYGAWQQEKEILAMNWMRHENIIEYYTSETHNKPNKARPQYWLITAYYKQGNLQTFLRNNTLKWTQFMNMAMGIARGLTFLHSEHDVNGKPKLPIAHRDMKSCNVLVKDNCQSCVIADLGLSFKLDPSLKRDELANAGQVGTSRYMAPELLERLVNLADIESFKRVDVYAMALVMWELMSRCEVIEPTPPYQPPFGSQITDHPTKEQMLVLVCRQKQRPEIDQQWRNHQNLGQFIESVEEMWDGDPEYRITSSCFYERLMQIQNQPMLVNEDELQKTQKEVENTIKEDLKITEKDVTELSVLINAATVV